MARAYDQTPTRSFDEDYGYFDGPDPIVLLDAGGVSSEEAVSGGNELSFITQIDTIGSLEAVNSPHLVLILHSRAFHEFDDSEEVNETTSAVGYAIVGRAVVGIELWDYSQNAFGVPDLKLIWVGTGEVEDSVWKGDEVATGVWTEGASVVSNWE